MAGKTKKPAVSPSKPSGADAVSRNETGTDGGFPVVGIGASAGGLAAFEAFFSGMPADADPGMAFVLVQHLAPDHKSILTELIRRYTRMQVFEVEDGMKVKPNCAYIIPPNCDMAFLNGTLQLMEPSAPRGLRLPIDFFFRSLAHDQRERAICIILSGTGSDGTLGVRAVKGEGGMVMAQSPESTEFDGMPRSVIATGLVDYELLPAEMPARIMAYVTHAFGTLPRSAKTPALMTENAMKKVFIMLRAQTGHDFSQYKPGTVNRRIERRLAVNQIENLDGYVKYLRQTPQEAEALFRDLLIGVTSFFRDPPAFKALEERVIPMLFAGKPPGANVRVWIPGCSTGEEAYSIAILLQEQLEVMKQGSKVQIFATDVDSQAIAAARAGIYPANIEADIPSERLARFFEAAPDGSTYRIRKHIRDIIVFSEQDVIRDPPFSKMDLISCRNLLIYLGNDLQRKLIPMFHYALNRDGVLFLGTSETVGEFGDLFEVFDRKMKVYRRRDDIHKAQRRSAGGFTPPLTMYEKPGPVAAALTPPVKLPLRELTEKALLQRASMAAALVNHQGDILYLHGRTGLYLEPVPGEAGVNNILKMAREGLRRALTTALHKAVAGSDLVRCGELSVKTNGDFTAVNLTIRPVADEASAAPRIPLYLVTLEESPPVDPSQHPQPGAASGSANGSADPEAEARIAELRQELRANEEYLQSTNEELETANEELKSSNEELQSTNEEMQSINEELETSKEELQSVNEELSTVNAELQTRVADLTRINNDMNNLLAGTGVGTLFVDMKMRILRFTPAATRIINLMLSDEGRPLNHIAANLRGYESLVADTQSVLDTLVPIEVEVQTLEGRWYAMRINPYRTLSNVIEGAVITFSEITEMKMALEALKEFESLRRLAVVLRDARDAVTVQDMKGRILAWNPGAVRLYGWSEAEALEMNVRDRIPEDMRDEALGTVLRLSQAEILEPYLTRRISKEGAVLEVSVISTALVNEAGEMYAVATTERLREPDKGNEGEA